MKLIAVKARQELLGSNAIFAIYVTALDIEREIDALLLEQTDGFLIE